MSEFKITGPGEYRTRNGLRVLVSRLDVPSYPYLWEANGFSYTDDGRIFYDEKMGISRDDIIGPWVEPAAERCEVTQKMPDGSLQPVKTLRDEYAMAALTGLLAAENKNLTPDTDENIAGDAYRLADAMMAARQKGGEK